MQGVDALYVVLTMDCLPAGEKGEIAGPGRWEGAARAPIAFAQAVRDLGLTAGFFVAPEALPRLRSTVRQLADEGCELGLLCHPQLSGYHAYLGSYSFDRQREIVALCRDAWSEHMGRRPETFRAGFFSANDYTYHVLCLEGFRQGNCSLPGRMDNDQCSMWFRSHPFPHHTDPLDRGQAGTMEFLEVPVTSDFEAASQVGYDTFTPPHLRIEEPDVHSYVRALVCRHLDGMDEEGALLRAVHLVTSNVAAWGAEEDPHAERLGNLCAILREVAQERGLGLKGASLASLHSTADAILGVDWRAEHEAE